MTDYPIRPDDALKYCAAILRSRTDWTCDSISGSMCNGDHEIELDAISDIVLEIRDLASRFGHLMVYSDGRRVESYAEIEPGFVTHHIWHPGSEEAPRSWRSPLPSGDPDKPSPGIYEVTTEPSTQDIHVRVVRLA